MCWGWSMYSLEECHKWSLWYAICNVYVKHYYTVMNSQLTHKITAMTYTKKTWCLFSFHLFIEYQCPTPKVYHACGPQVVPTCDSWYSISPTHCCCSSQSVFIKLCFESHRTRCGLHCMLLFLQVQREIHLYWQSVQRHDKRKAGGLLLPKWHHPPLVQLQWMCVHMW